ncbi:hypothetical protein Fcan01_11060 [Folsomia candida]|uniref:E3 ubiquitin-protein ligase TRIM71 n=2 Tax=Folsomia candida TaxID=158441 RepID=A0A226ECF8_FOLCA|nr:hypothetical protein Fcan01_11060 [Folsomia candida]
MSSRKLGNEYSEEFQRELSWIWKMLENRNVTEISAKEVIPLDLSPVKNSSEDSSNGSPSPPAAESSSSFQPIFFTGSTPFPAVAPSSPQKFNPIVGTSVKFSPSPAPSSSGFRPLPINILPDTSNLWETEKSNLLSNYVGRVDRPVPIYTHPAVVGERTFEKIVPQTNYVLQKADGRPNIDKEEVYFYLLPDKSQSVSADESTAAKNTMLKVCGKITHASGQSSSVEMQKLDHSPGFLCSFVPPFPGKYSANLFHCPNGIVEDVDSKQLCPAIQLDVSRNYSSDARTPSIPMIRLGNNGDKYWGISVDHYADRLYVTDRDQSDVIVIDSTTSKIIKRFGGRQSSLGFHDGQLYRPSGISVDHVNKRLLVCDKDHHHICIYSMDGLFVSSFGTKGYGPGEFTYPWDVDASSDGKMIAVSDSQNHRVQVFDRFGNYLAKFSVFEKNPYGYKKLFEYPRGVAFSKDGRYIFATDFNTSSIMRIEVASGELKTMGRQGSKCRLQGVTVDEMGNILTCDSRHDCLRVSSEDGTLLHTLRHVGKNRLGVPVDACITRDGHVATLTLKGEIYFI